VRCFGRFRPLLQLLLLYTFARSESPLQKSWTGEGAFDPHKNLQVRDVKVATVGGRRAVGVRLKAIKQDPRMARPEAQGEGDWVWIGESDGDTNIIMWLQLYFSFFAGQERSPFDPFFLARDQRRGLLYSHGMDDVRALWARTPGVTPELAKTCGLHGLRVAGNNGTTKSLGKELARAQGGWASEQTQSRYDRHDFTMTWRMLCVFQRPSQPLGRRARWSSMLMRFEKGRAIRLARPLRRHRPRP